ncbi:hypothetical protein, partial [Halomonas llamarensis]
ARLLNELKDTINSGVIERKGITREAPLKVWITALDQLLERPPSNLPLNTHGYLYEVVANCADRHAGEQEKQQEEAKRSGAKQPANRPPAAAFQERSTDDVLAEHARMANRPSTVATPKKGQHQTAKAAEQANAPKRLADLLKGTGATSEEPTR